MTPFLLTRAVVKNHRESEKWVHLAQRIGLVEIRGRRPKVLWIHAVSVGEVNATIPLLKRLTQDYPEYQIVLSTTTVDGAKIVRTRLSNFVTHVYFPLDIPWVISRFLNEVKPKAFIMIETELWPNLLLECARRGIPSLLLNARLSDKSLKSYQGVKSISRQMMSNITFVLARSTSDADNFVSLGLSRDKVRTVGNMKFDYNFTSDLIDDTAAGSTSEHGLTVCFGSIHEGEFGILVDVMLQLREKLSGIRFILAPRHPAKLESYARHLRRLGISFVSGDYQAYVIRDRVFDVFLVDSIGELLKFYSASAVAFVGGSLVPLGGQNLLEPISVGVPVITGPSLYNFQEIADGLIALDIVVSVTDATSMTEEICDLLKKEQKRESKSSRGREWLASKQGATQQTMAVLRLFI